METEPSSGDAENKEAASDNKKPEEGKMDETVVIKVEADQENQPVGEADKDKENKKEDDNKDKKEGKEAEKDVKEDPDKEDPLDEAELEAAVKMLEEVPPTEVINVTTGLLKRTHYPKLRKPRAKLDGLLERRMKHYELEQKQKSTIEAIINKFKHQEDGKRKLVAAAQAKREEPDVDVVNMKNESKDGPAQALPNGDIKMEVDASGLEKLGSGYACYSPACRKTKETTCYSVTCHESDETVKQENGADSVKSENGEDMETDPAENSTKESLPGTKDSTAATTTASAVTTSNTAAQVSKAGTTTTTSTTTTTTASTSILKASVTGAPPPAKSTVTTLANTAVGQTISSLIQGGKIQLSAASVADLEKKLARVGKTQYHISLAKVPRGAKGKVVRPPKKGILPVCQKFMTKGGKKTLFILEKHCLKHLARKAGMREARGFNYNCKMNNVQWVYPCPRPRFKTTWRYRTQKLQTLAGAALQLRVLWACIRWDDLSTKPPAGGTNTVTTETDITTKELLKRRDVGPYGLQSEYIVRKIVIPIGVPEKTRG